MRDVKFHSTFLSFFFSCFYHLDTYFVPWWYLRTVWTIPLLRFTHWKNPTFWMLMVSISQSYCTLFWRASNANRIYENLCLSPHVMVNCVAVLCWAMPPAETWRSCMGVRRSAGPCLCLGRWFCSVKWKLLALRSSHSEHCKAFLCAVICASFKSEDSLVGCFLHIIPCYWVQLLGS